MIETRRTSTAYGFRLAVILVLLVGAWMRWRVPADAPPGLGMDEVIASQIADDILAGDWRVFYAAGQGREPLFNYWLAGWFILLGRRVFALRIASSTLSILGMAATFAFLRGLFGKRTALIALAFQATSLWSIFPARAGARSVSLVPLASLAGLFFWRWLNHAPDTAKGKGHYVWAAWTGLFLGLVQYTYTAARVLPIVFGVVLVHTLFFHRELLKHKWKSLALWVILASLVAAPLFIHLVRNPQSDEFNFENFSAPFDALKAGDPGPAIQSSLATLQGFVHQGDPLLFNNLPDRPIFDTLSAIAFLVGLAIVLWNWRKPAYWTLFAWSVIGLLPGMLSQPAPNLYRIVLSQSTVFALPALALSALDGFTVVRARLLRVLAVVTVMVVMGVHAHATFTAYFEQWPQILDVRYFWQSSLMASANYLDTAEDDTPVAICTILTSENDPWWRAAWQSMDYLMAREDLDIRYYDCRSTLVSISETSRYIFTDTAQPFSPLHSRLRSGPVEGNIESSTILPDDAGVVALVQETSEIPLLEQSAVYLAPESSEDDMALPVGFGDAFVFTSYSIDAQSSGDNTALTLITQWRVTATPSPNLAMFTHVLSDATTIIGQQDGLPVTTQSLHAGDTLWVVHDQLFIPQDTDAYEIAIGLYSRDTMQRLPIVINGEATGDRLFLLP